MTKIWPLFFLLSLSAVAEDRYELEDIRVLGSKEQVFFTPGSAHVVTSEELQQFDYTDVGRVLEKTPGVYIQDEDGLGLRPNIGMRGAHPHRSRKVTIMEDSILVGPAPYSAPAAYYFPFMSRISDVEVYKGPSSVQYGPNSIGGALNLVTRGIQKRKQAVLDLGLGRINKTEISGTGVYGHAGYLLQVSNIFGETNKELISGDKTYFDQKDILLKTSYDLGKSLGTRDQRIKLKLSYAEEDSDETYLGVSQNEFSDLAYKRYAVSQDDKMEWERSGIQLDYSIRLNEKWTMNNTAYLHKMERDWNKFNGLNDDTKDLRDILNNNSDASIIALLRGDRDSIGNSERLIIGNNAREYYSKGVQTKNTLTFTTGEEVYHQLKVGLRVHEDQVERNHIEQLADLVDGNLRYVSGSETFTNKNQDTSYATTLFLEDEINYKDFTISLGSRFEELRTVRRPRDGSDNIENSDSIFVPGIGVNYSLNPSTVLLAGINKGITVVGPGQDDDVKPEEATNYEFGVRINKPVYFEFIGFFSDYQNIKGTCTFSSGCLDDAAVDTEYNGGEAEIYGFESLLSHTFSKGKWQFPVQLTYSYTIARFTEDTVSENKEWGIGNIDAGDPLPYIPQNQISFKVGTQNNKWGTYLNYTYKDEMADQSVDEGRNFIPSFSVIDFSLHYNYTKQGRVYFKVDNVLDETYITSLRPFGARPGKPRTLMLGLRQQF